MSYFAYESAAKRYNLARPYFHPLVMDKISKSLNLQEPLLRALDIGCGTGQSTRALTAIAREVVGADISPAMLNEAEQDPHIHYLCASAEQIPLPDASFDLITVSLAFHWFDRPRFLAEANRLLCLKRWLVLYSNSFTGTMVENPLFEKWNWNTYIARYPIPPRNNHPLTETEVQRYGFQLLKREQYSNNVSFSPEELVSYLMTQSNVIASIEQGSESATDVYNWLLTNVASLFQGTRGTFRFGGSIEYMQKEKAIGHVQIQSQ